MCRVRLKEFTSNEGVVVSVPVAWFNVCPFKDSFSKNGRNHFLVAVVHASNKTTQLHEMQILGTMLTENFNIDETFFNKCRQTWYEHGQRYIPHYEIGKKTHDFDVGFGNLSADSDTTSTKGKHQR
jgi:hypothetical protein